MLILLFARILPGIRSPIFLTAGIMKLSWQRFLLADGIYAVPGVSPAAKQMGRTAAANLLRRLRGEPTKPFHYVDYGNLATVGRKAAVVDLTVPRLGAIRFSGLLAWLFWLFAHIYFLIGFRNRLMVLTDWAWAYWTYARNARVVADPAAERPASSRS